MNYFKFIFIIFGLLVIDLLSKFFFYDMGVLSHILSPTFNTGISFGVEVNILFVRSVTIIFLIVVSYLSFKKRIHPRAGIFLIAGTLGNFIDRIQLHGVRDFVWLGFGAVFNIADVYITTGVVLAFRKEFRNTPKIKTIK